MIGAMRALLLIALAACGPIAAPVAPPPPSTPLDSLAQLVGHWRGDDGTGWRYDLVVTGPVADGLAPATFEQWIDRGGGDRCRQAGTMTRREPEGENFAPRVDKVACEYEVNDCNPDFAGGSAWATVRSLGADRVVLVWPDATVTFVRDTAPTK